MSRSEEDSMPNLDGNRSKPVTGKSCKGTLYYSSVLKSKGRNPRCFGLSTRLQQAVPSYFVGESEAEAAKEGRPLTDFRYGCVGYSVYLDKKDGANDENKTGVELPICVGIELLVDKRPVVDHASSAHARTREGLLEMPAWLDQVWRGTCIRWEFTSKIASMICSIRLENGRNEPSDILLDNPQIVKKMEEIAMKLNLKARLLEYFRAPSLPPFMQI